MLKVQWLNLIKVYFYLKQSKGSTSVWKDWWDCTLPISDMEHRHFYYSFTILNVMPAITLWVSLYSRHLEAKRWKEVLRDATLKGIHYSHDIFIDWNRVIWSYPHAERLAYNLAISSVGQEQESDDQITISTRGECWKEVTWYFMLP